MRIMRRCYDKPHRCPGWAGGGWHYPKDGKVICGGGSLRHYTLGRWLPERHPACGTWALPIWTKWLDPEWWRFVISRAKERSRR